MSKFDITKYLGIWYELMHYPSWFQRNDNYNTTAEYSMTRDGVIIVHNSTITRGEPFDSYGTATQMGEASFRVDFAPPEVERLEVSQEFKPPMDMAEIIGDPSQPNYVIDKIWLNQYGEYIFAVVTNPERDALYVLSRFKHPSLTAYNEIMSYVVENYDRDRLVQTPHFN